MNILVFTTEYPDINKENSYTKAVHYFAREWVKSGHNVVVIHNEFILQRPSSYLDFIVKDHEKSIQSYKIEGVQVYSNQVKRYIPKSTFILPWEVKNVATNIISYLKKIEFVPDISVVHFCAQQWKIIKSIRKTFPINPVPIFHNTDLKSDKKVKEILSGSSKIGVRSMAILEKIKGVSRLPKNVFQVESGAPDYIFNLQKPEKDPSVIKFLFVGRLIPSKNIEVILYSLSRIKNEYNFVFQIIGEGICENELRQLTYKLNIQDKVIFSGKETRSEVIQQMLLSDCFIMVSSPETLGIVYLEAMACENVVIGSKGEGIEGIIIDKENGFLAEPGDVNSLTNVLVHFLNMGVVERKRLLLNSINTVEKMKESIVAQRYLNEIITHNNKN